ncbi:FAD:protein FMN transferase [Saliniradius amylolyticus]|uniref:FAD:protein FMN transferase n=1 Tax=Saliniradius amylolyticus TaxID=2183582 RepID=A0A2S2E6P6_9ALTE|nr:FAD:protein FMN transferase [Saliniradius amylolyticus]AWL13336.1 FAD:protein FMN transferase [Saliniradius amylolyticus]
MGPLFKLSARSDHFCGRFEAMASPCELLIETDNVDRARLLMQKAVKETRRIEHKFSRYRQDNLWYRVNQSRGKPVAIDEETYQLLQFANTCYRLSEGLFDITSGVLRRAWRFDGSDHLPSAQHIEALMPLIGWRRIQFDTESIIVPEGMELDLGGIGKEYAVDRVAALCLKQAPGLSVVVNFGGDVQVTCPRKTGQPWHIGIESPDRENEAHAVLQIQHGGLATSGDARKYLLKDGIRYGHILNPLTGYPVEGAPRSITVATAHCTQAGLLATLAMLQGLQAETFLKQQQVSFWVSR